MAGRLGDGHITKGDQPLYTETHAEDQKNYLFWKFSKLPTICSTLPKYTPAKIKTLNGKDYLCQASYRLSSRVLDELAEIRDMSKLDIINLLSGLGVSLYFLDDGYRDNSNWSLCTGVLTDEEVERLIFILKINSALPCGAIKTLVTLLLILPPLNCWTILSFKTSHTISILFSTKFPGHIKKTQRCLLHDK